MVEGSTTSEDGVHIGRCERGEGRSGGTLNIVYGARLDWGGRGWHDVGEMVGGRWGERGQRWWDVWRWWSDERDIRVRSGFGAPQIISCSCLAHSAVSDGTN